MRLRCVLFVGVVCVVGASVLAGHARDHTTPRLAASPQMSSAERPAPGAQPYLTPPQAIVDILDAPPPPDVDVSPARDLLLLLERRSMPPLDELAEPMLRLAGARINPRTHGPHRTPGIVGLRVQPVRGGDADETPPAEGAARAVTLPEDANILPLGFSPDGAQYAFGLVGDDAIALWLLDRSAVTAQAVDGIALNATAGSACDWLDDSSALVCRAVPPGRGEAPTAPSVPDGPNVQESRGATAPVRTYQDLLATTHDEALFEHYIASQMVYVDRTTRRVTPAGEPGVYGRVTPSPDGEYLLVVRYAPPYSRLLPAGGFPKAIEVWSRDGELVRTIADLPSDEGVPLNGVPVGPRDLRWQPDVEARLVWAEALDEGDLRNEVPHRDQVMTLGAPFTADPAEWVKTEHRFRSVSWTDRGVALVREFDRPTRHERTWIIDEPGAEPRQLWDRNEQDRYGDPGTPVMRPGRRTILQEGDAIYLTGAGASDEGDRPFLDRLDLETGGTTRLFQTGEHSYEPVEALLTDDGREIVTKYETREDYPNYFLRNTETGERRPLTQFTDPAPQLAEVTKQLVTYTRDDGVQLSGTLYLPPNYDEGTRLPMVMWAYPREYVDPTVASQVSGSPHRFVTIAGASHLLLLAEGYAIFDNPAMPVVGPGETANDTYVEQLVASAEAAVDKVVSMGVTDRERIGIGGHSYGAFMTANLLAHSDLFRAGIARSGAYNRSLTPFGFQAERRPFWEVPEVYARMSPFWYADQINEPLLLIHGEADNNSGTFPIQSERFYMAVKGHGGTSRYVTLPHESHGYAARESVLHVVAEMLNWMDEHVKHAEPSPTPTSAGSGSRAVP